MFKFREIYYKPDQYQRLADKMHQQDLNKNLEKVPWLAVQRDGESLG